VYSYLKLSSLTYLIGSMLNRMTIPPHEGSGDKDTSIDLLFNNLEFNNLVLYTSEFTYKHLLAKGVYH